MNVISELENIYRSYNRRINNGDGIYKGGGAYFPTFFHGDEQGRIGLESPQGIVHYIEPEEIRWKISVHHGVEISQDSWIMLYVCHPYFVRERYGSRLDNSNIFIPIDWKVQTYQAMLYSDTRKLVMDSNFRRDFTDNKYDMVVASNELAILNYMHPDRTYGWISPIGRGPHPWQLRPVLSYSRVKIGT